MIKRLTAIDPPVYPDRKITSFIAEISDGCFGNHLEAAARTSVRLKYGGCRQTVIKGLVHSFVKDTEGTQ